MIERRFYWKYRDATQTGWVRERKVGDEVQIDGLYTCPRNDP